MQLKCQLFKEVLVAPGLDDVAPLHSQVPLFFCLAPVTMVEIIVRLSVLCLSPRLDCMFLKGQERVCLTQEQPLQVLSKD